MHYFLIVHVLEGTGNLAHVLPDEGLVERIIVSGVLLDELLEIALFCPLGDDVELIILDEGVDVLDDVGMVQWLHQLYLLETLVP